MEVELLAPGGHDGSWNLCMLCFTSDATLIDSEFKDIDAYEEVIENLLQAKLLQDDAISQKICSGCDIHIESMRVLKERVQFSNIFWSTYLDQAKDAPDTTYTPNPHSDVLLNCHLCGKCYSRGDLVTHLLTEHEMDHVPSCALCKALLATTGVSYSTISLADNETIEEMEEGDENKEQEDCEEEEVDGDEEMIYLNPQEESKSDRLNCDLCEKSYATKDKLRTHKRVVHKINPLACLTCYLVLATRKELNSHIQSCHNVKISERISNSKRRFNCNYCSMAFVFENKLRKHLLLHPEASLHDDNAASKRREYSCTHCDKKFTRSNLRDDHMEKNHDNPFPCNSCDPAIHFATRAELKDHESTLHAFKCDTCNRVLRSEALYEAHLKGHLHEVYACPNCDKLFKCKEQLTLHRKTAHEKPHRCPVCHDMFEKGALNDHVAESHEKLTCFTCSVEFPTLKGLKLHEITHKEILNVEEDITVNEVQLELSKVKREFACDKCEASFKSQKKLDLHIADKHDEKGYNCDQCNKVFVSKAKLRQHSYKHNMKLCGICGVRISTSLSTHLMRHANDKPFKCLVEGCGRTFPRNSDLSEHTKVHTGEKPFSCEVCGMRFTRRNKVTVHMRTHTGEKPYKCTFPDCEKQFAQSFDLKLHIRRHTGEKPYECTACGERFILTALLKTHRINCAAVIKEEGGGG